MEVTFDQLAAFVRVGDTGSFSAAARELGRAQSNISRSVRQLERLWGVTLFDRSGRLPVLTPTGLALVDDARGVVESVSTLSARAARRASADEHEVSLVVDGVFPLTALVEISRGFQREFPEVTLKLRTEYLGAVIEAIANETAMIGVSSPVAERQPNLKRRAIGEVRLVAVAASTHPLANHPGPIAVTRLQGETQIILSDRSRLTEGVELAVLSHRTLSVAELGTKLELIRAGIGWGNLPEHMVTGDLKDGALARLYPEPWSPNEHMLTLTQVVRTDFSPGKASSWLMNELVRVCSGSGRA